MAKSPEIYVDTSALIAFVDRSDSYHALFSSLFANPPTLLTSTLVVAEGHAWFLRRYDRRRALQFLSMIEVMAPLRVTSPSITEHKAAVSVLRRFSDQDLTMVDALGLHWLEAKQMRECWSTDFHLGLTGVPLAIHLH